MTDPLDAPERVRSAVAYGAMATVAPLVATAATALQWLRASSAGGGPGELGGTVWALLSVTFAAASALIFGAVAGAVAIARWFAARDFDD